MTNLLVALAVAASAAAVGTQTPYVIPVEYAQLDNGLKVVLSVDRTAPTASVAVYYKIGFRIEPKDRTGFAHLFEHMMFQGSHNLGKMEFIRLVQSNGGVLNGSTRFDFTNYFEVVPANAVETALWAEADRMRGLAITQENLTNQQGVVKNEVKVNVLNQPYEGFPWIDMPMVANENWYNAHNFYGDMQDLDAATLTDASAFFRRYYAPNNAVLGVVGDFNLAQTKAWVEKYFGQIAASELPPPPDLTEPRQTAEKRTGRVDSLANRPAIAFAWHMPERWTPEWFAMGMIDQILGQGRDSRLYQTLVTDMGYTGDVSAGINWGLGHQFNYQGPMLWMVSVYHDSTVAPDSLVASVNRTIEDLQTKPIDAATMTRARTKIRSALYDMMEQLSGFGRLDMLAAFALFDNDPGRINRLEAEFGKVTPELIQRTAREFLRRENRTVYTIVPGAKAAAAGTQ
jgi:zinc protease